MKWDGTQEGERYNKEIWKDLRTLETNKNINVDMVSLFLGLKQWLSDLDRRVARMGVAGKLPPLFVELMLRDYMDAANVRQNKEGIKATEAIARIKRMCEAWEIDYKQVTEGYGHLEKTNKAS